jgi:hypothetical protein
MLKQAILSALLVVPISGAPVWTPTHAQFDRRLGIDTVASHSNTSDDNCVVGAYNTEEPSQIYVGGPCSELGADNTPSDKFRWVEMYTFYADLEGTDGSTADLKSMPGGVVHPMDGNAYAKIAVGGSFMFEDVDFPKANLFMSTTSYLSKADFEFNTNDFTVDQNQDGSYTSVEGVCIQPCTGTGGACDGCPTAKTTANAGDYKYSLFAASYDGDSAIAGANGNGWAKAVDKYGSGDPKALSGYLNVYQAVDFSNMKADTLTMTSPDGTSVKYKDMASCSLANLATCTAYSVSSVLVESDNWSGLYTFPKKYNKGEWTVAANAIATEPKMTQDVGIMMIKPDEAWLKSVGYENYDASKTKVVFIEYKFDISGVTADATSGRWMAYDPTVQNAKGSNAKAKAAAAANAAANSGGSTSGTGETSGTSMSWNFSLIQLVLSVAAWLLVQS